LDPILSELDDDEPPQGEYIAGQVSAQLNALPEKCGELVRAYLMPEGSERTSMSLAWSRTIADLRFPTQMKQTGYIALGRPWSIAASSYAVRRCLPHTGFEHAS
jgi:hypothetical protein